MEVAYSRMYYNVRTLGHLRKIIDEHEDYEDSTKVTLSEDESRMLEVWSRTDA